jgi:uncharacterized protein YcnI
MKKTILYILSVFLFFVPFVVSAHSTVTPSQSTTSKYENFVLSVPTEKEVPTVGLRLLIPEGLDKITPQVKPGWKIDVKKNSDGVVTEIDWTGGSIPAGQKDIFQFTARTPKDNATLIWKVYQTYQGGEVVAWDRDPKTPAKEGETVNPYSVTEVKADTGNSVPVANTNQSNNKLPYVLSVAALAISLFALSRVYKSGDSR